jgi:hypothetical protein
MTHWTFTSILNHCLPASSFVGRFKEAEQTKILEQINTRFGQHKEVNIGVNNKSLPASGKKKMRRKSQNESAPTLISMTYLTMQ